MQCRSLVHRTYQLEAVSMQLKHKLRVAGGKKQFADSRFERLDKELQATSREAERLWHSWAAAAR
jgi:hypothetical protein